MLSKKNSSRKPKICITVPLVYPLFKKGLDAPFGGIEVRISVLARELASRNNLDVNIVVGDYGQPHIEKIDGITFYSWKGRPLWGVQKPGKNTRVTISRQIQKIESNIGSLGRLVRPIKLKIIKLIGMSQTLIIKFTAFLKGIDPMSTVIAGYAINRRNISIYDEVDADLYLVPGNSQFSAEIAFYCKKRHKKYILIGASEMDFYPEYKKRKGNDIYGVPFALKVYNIMNAHAYIVQNPDQQEMLREGYGVTSTVIKNPVDPTPLFPIPENQDTILWVGKSYEPVKQPSIVLKLARDLPTYPFILIMNKAIEETHQQCLREAAKLSNVTIIEKVPFEEVEKYYAEARLHINTSSFEGFPNTYLQAAKYGVPTVSLQVDPAGMLSEYGCGLVSGGDYGTFKDNVKKMMDDRAFYAQFEKASLEYIQKYHAKSIIAAEYEKVLSSFLK